MPTIGGSGKPKPSGDKQRGGAPTRGKAAPSKPAKTSRSTQPSQPPRPSRPSGGGAIESGKPDKPRRYQRDYEQPRQEQEIATLRQWATWGAPAAENKEDVRRTSPPQYQPRSSKLQSTFVPFVAERPPERNPQPSAPPDVLRGPYEPRSRPPALSLQKDVTGQGVVSTATPPLSASAVGLDTVQTRPAPLRAQPDILRGRYYSPQEEAAARSRRIRENASLSAMGVGNLLDILPKNEDDPTALWLEQNRFKSPQEAIEWFSPDAIKARRAQIAPPSGAVAGWVARTDRRFGLATDQGQQGQAAREEQAAHTPPPAPDTLQYSWPQQLLSSWRAWRAGEPANEAGQAVALAGAYLGSLFDMGFQVPAKQVLTSPLNPIRVEQGNTDFYESHPSSGVREQVPSPSLYRQYDPEKDVTYVGGNSPAMIYGNAKDVVIQYVKDIYKGEDFFGAINRWYLDEDFRNKISAKAWAAWEQKVLESKRSQAYGQTLPYEDRWDYMAAQDRETSGDFPTIANLIDGRDAEVARLYAEADRQKSIAETATDQRIKAEAAYASANAAAQARQLENMYVADLAESQMDLSDMVMELAEGIFGDPTNLIPFGYADEIADVARAAARTPAEVIAEVETAAQQADDMLAALLTNTAKGAPPVSPQQALSFPAVPSRVTGDIRKGAGRPAKEAKSTGPAFFNPFGRTRESLSLDAKASAHSIINTVTSFGETPIAVADARKIITAMIDDPASLFKGIPASEFISPQIKEFAQADGKVYWPTGLGDVLKQNQVFFKNARDDILNSPFLLAPDASPLARGSFMGQVNEIIYDSSRRLYGVADVPADVPMGAHTVKVKPVKDNPNVKVLEYLDANGNLAGRSQPVSADSAQQLASQYQKSLRASEHGAFVRIARTPMQIQKRIMTDLGLIFNPAFIIRNAANGMGVMFSDDLMSFTKVKDIDDMMRRFGVDALRIAEGRAGGIQSGLEGAQRAGRGNAYTRFRDKVAQLGAFGRAEIPLPGGQSLAIGEQAFYTKIWGEAFQRFWRQEWPNTVNAHFIKPLLEAGLPPEVVNALGQKLAEHGLKGDKAGLSHLLRGDINAGSIKPVLFELMNNKFIIEKMPMPLRFNLDKALDAYNGDMTEIVAIFDEWKRQNAVNLAAVGEATPGSGVNTVSEMKQDMAAMYDEAVRNGISAGLPPQEAKAAAQAQVKSYQDSFQYIQTFLRDVSNTQPSDVAATVSINTWMDLYEARWELRAYHNQTYDEVFTRNAAPGITPEQKSANWLWKTQQDAAANQRYKEKVQQLIADAREALSKTDFPDAETVRTRWQNMYQEYAAHAASDYADRGLEAGRVGDDTFARVMVAHQNYIDEAYIALFDAVARQPTPEAFDIMIEANTFADMQLAMAEAKRLAARQRAHELTDGVPPSSETNAVWAEYRTIRDQAYRQAADAARQRFEAAYEVIVGKAPPPGKVAPPPPVTPTAPAAAAQPSSPFPNGPAVWRHGDIDEPVTITGILGEQNGERYYSIEGRATGVPESQLMSPPSERVLPSEAEINAQTRALMGLPENIEIVPPTEIQKGDTVYLIGKQPKPYTVVEVRSRNGEPWLYVQQKGGGVITIKGTNVIGRDPRTPRVPYSIDPETGRPYRLPHEEAAAPGQESVPPNVQQPAPQPGLGRGSPPVVSQTPRQDIPQLRLAATNAGIDSQKYDNHLLNSINKHADEIGLLKRGERITNLSQLTPEEVQKAIAYYEGRATQAAAPAAPAAPAAQAIAGKMPLYINRKAFGDSTIMAASDGTLSAMPPPSKPTLVGYKWVTTKEEFDNGIDVILRRVSDWDKALKAEETNRSIVHHYYIWDTDGSVKVYGKPTALKKLGLSRDGRLTRFAQESIARQKADLTYVKEWSDRIPSLIAQDKNGALINVRKRVTNLPAQHTRMWTKDGQYIVTNDDPRVASYMLDSGWDYDSTYSHNPAAQKPTAPVAQAAPTTPSLVGNRTTAYDASNASARPVDVQYEVVEYSDLVTSDKPGFPPELQPRDRTQAALQLQVDQIANNLQPRLLLEDGSRIDGGSPIVGTGNIVESGNGRMMGFGKASPQAQAAYKQELLAIAKQYGLDPAAIEQMQNPVLVRRRLSGDAQSFVNAANARTTAGMNTLETSSVLAGQVAPSDLAPLLELNDAPIATQLTRAGAQEAVRRIMARIPANERAALVGPNGELTQAGVKTIRDAILSIIIRDDALRANYISDLDTEFRNIGRAIEIAAGKLAYLEKTNPELALGNAFSEAAQNLILMRDKGWTVDQFFGQGALFGAQSPEVEALTRFLAENKTRAPRMGDMLVKYADAALKQEGQGSLLAEGAASMLEMLEGAIRTAGDSGQGTMLFSFPGNVIYGGEKGIQKLVSDWKANRARNARMGGQVEVAHPFFDEFLSIDAVQKQVEQVLAGGYPTIPNTLTQQQRLAAIDALNQSLRQWDNNLIGAEWFATKAGDFGMLNYGDQRNFDVLLSMIMPYHFFWSRSASNWLKRMATRPALFNIYWEIEQELKNAQRQNQIWNEGDPARVGGMIPVFGRSFVGNPLNLFFPNNSYLANEFVDPETANNEWERWWLRSKQITPIGGPLYDTAIAGVFDYLYPRPAGAMPRWKEEATIGNLGPIPRLATYAWQGVTGDIAPAALSGNAYMHGIVGRYLAADKSITPQQYRWALDYGMRLMTGYPPLPEEPPYAKELWDKAAKQAGMDYLTTKALSTLTGVPWGVMAPGEREMIQAKNLRRGLGAQGGENPYGSHAAQVEFDRLTNEAALRGAQYPTLYQKIDAPLPTEYSQNRPGVQAVRNQQQAELDALEARYKQATDDYYEAHISEKTADIQKGLDALAAQYNKDKDAIKAKYASTLREEPEYPTAYKNYSQDEVDAAAYNKAKFAAIEQAGEYPDKLPKGSTNAQYEQRDAQIKAIEQKQLELLTDMLFDSQELSRYVNGRSVTPLTYEQAAAKAKEILADDSWKAPGFQKIGARWDKEAEVREADKQEAKSLFGDDILNLWDQFTALPKGDARRIFKAQHPQLYDYENFLEKKGYFDSDTPETPALPTTPEEIMAYLASLAAGTGAAGGTDNGQAFRPGAIESMTPAQRTEAQRQFGKDILILATQYSLLPKDSQERRDFIAEHPELSGYWDYLEEIGIYEARTGGGTGTPGTWARMSPEQRTEAQERFGEDIDTLARQYGKLPKGSQARKDFLKAHPQLSDYWDYLEEIGIYEAKVDSGYAQRSGEGYDSLGHRAYGSFAMGGGGGWGWGGGGGSWADLPQAQYVDTDFRSWEPPRRSNSREGYVRRNTDTWKLSDIPLKQLRMWR